TSLVVRMGEPRGHQGRQGEQNWRIAQLWWAQMKFQPGHGILVQLRWRGRSAQSRIVAQIHHGIVGPMKTHGKCIERTIRCSMNRKRAGCGQHSALDRASFGNGTVKKTDEDESGKIRGGGYMSVEIIFPWNRHLGCFPRQRT